MSNKLAVTYYRVSTMDQFENNSLQSQREACRIYCEAQGLTVITEVPEVESGADWNRPGLYKVREAIAQGATNVVVYQEDRLGRGAIDAALLEEEFTDLGVELHLVGEGGGQ